ncbi:hypothetical protein [Streptomyces sp. MUM 178J]|uniref:hypothetical protein n=1 Tax=Streptomyces sp. MUM 178J TaxID=2791991 RepID=UPI002E7B63F0|nr:hypothetical protein [Streptomyces sp. MUM 178J]WRQ79806.1 hypothetical protein I3F59_010860 [Streptomyces sp. MUM 178J]
MKRARASKRNDALLYAQRAAMGLVAALLLAAGFWSSWSTAQHVILSKGREHGTLTVTGCSTDVCTGRYAPDDPATPRDKVTIEKSVAVDKGAVLSVVLKPGTAEAVRTGPAGTLHAWLPLAGALVLAALVIGGGLRMTRTAWAAGAVGGVLLVGTFFAL